MKKSDGLITLFGVIFLVMGILWLSAIFVRYKVYFPKEDKKVSVVKVKNTYAQIYQSSVKQYKRIAVHLAPFSVKSYMPKAFIIYFWVIGALEFVCAIFYLLAGIFVLRRYFFGAYFVFYMLITDILLKVLIVIYSHYILTPLKTIFRTSNIMFTYFTRGEDFISKVPLYLTGIKLVQPGFLYYLFFYLMYVSICFYVFRINREIRVCK